MEWLSYSVLEDPAALRRLRRVCLGAVPGCLGRGLAREGTQREGGSLQELSGGREVDDVERLVEVSRVTLGARRGVESA